MPFYVAYSNKRRKVAIRSASPVQFIICYEIGSIISLEAVVQDYQNQRNVEFDWEQIEGTTVVLSHPKELVTTFEYTDNSDKIFRFYIDKDTARETSIDCRVYHTPISFQGQGFSTHNHIGTNVLDVASRDAAVKTAGYSRTIIPDVESIPAVQFTFEYFIPSELVSISTRMVVLYSPDARVNPYQVIDVYTDTSNLPATYTAARGFYIFALDVVYPSGHAQTYYSHIHASIPSDVVDDSSHTVDDLIQQNMVIETKNILKYTFKVQKPITAVNISSSPQPVLDNVRRFDNISADGQTAWDDSRFALYTFSTYNIVKLDPSGVGSGT